MAAVTMRIHQSHPVKSMSYGSIITKQKTKPNPFRWWVYFGCSFVMFTTWYSFFIPSGLQSEFMRDYNLTDDGYALLFSVATGPTFLVPLFAGIIIDKTGIGYPLIISSSIICIAQILFLISCIRQSEITMYLSRCLLGFGTCCWQIGMNAILTKYFKHAELAVVLFTYSFLQIMRAFL